MILTFGQAVKHSRAFEVLTRLGHSDPEWNPWPSEEFSKSIFFLWSLLTDKVSYFKFLLNKASRDTVTTTPTPTHARMHVMEHIFKSLVYTVTVNHTISVLTANHTVI